MAPRVIDRESGQRPLGLAFRRRRPGPEREIIDRFLEQNPIEIPRGCRLTIFQEPRIESGFPDLVAVVWNEGVARTWNPERANLSKADIQLTHYLYHAGPCDDAQLRRLLLRNLTASIERLHSAGMIRSVDGRWSMRTLSRLFAARRIIAIEAKVTEWDVALRQAFLNTWFASESYVLVPHIPKTGRLLDDANLCGIGVWASAEKKARLPSSFCNPLPCSYASWLFNDWAWRAELHL